MVSTKKDRVLVTLSLSGGNDVLNTVIPYNNPLYRDYRPNLGIPESDVLPINDQLAFNPALAPLKKFWDAGKMAIILGVGYPHPSRSHFRAMDIWHTCEPEKVATEGWLGRVIQDLDPDAGNVLTGVNFGRGLPRALAKDGVPVASVGGDLATYGLLTGIEEEDQRAQALDVFSRMYSPAIGRSAVLDYIHHTGTNALKGADILATAPEKYTSQVEYSDTILGQYMKSLAQVHFADFGSRILYTTSPYNSFDTHANQAKNHGPLWQDVSNNVETFFDDLREHEAGDEVLMLLFSEFGRRAWDNGSGTDHGTGGAAFVIGNAVKGGIYGEYPSLDRNKLEDGGDLQHNVDFRSIYTTISESWLGLDPVSIVGGQFEPVDFL
jgi:uncharacterized protein (DUF1501 family)